MYKDLYKLVNLKIIILAISNNLVIWLFYVIYIYKNTIIFKIKNNDKIIIIIFWHIRLDKDVKNTIKVIYIINNSFLLWKDRVDTL